jgi:phosphate-selective porin OprO and OprP
MKWSVVVTLVRCIACFVPTVCSSIALRAQENASPKTEAAASGFALHSSDGAWTLRIRGLVQLDARVFDGDSRQTGDNGWLLRRVRPTLEGTFGDRVAFRLMPDFGDGRSEVPDAWVDVELRDGGPVLRAGKFKPPVGLERLRAANHLQLIERSIVTELVPKRDIGVQISGGNDRLAWAAGLFNGVVDGGMGDEDADGKQDLAVRVFSHPFSGESRTGALTELGLGFAATYGGMRGSTAVTLLPGYRSPGQETVFAYRNGAEATFAEGERLRVTPQFYWYRHSFGLMGEAARVSQDVRRAGIGFDRANTLDHDAWQVTANYFLTGESAGYKDPSVAGAIELVARASGLDTDPDSFSGGATSFADPATAILRADTRAVGVNWYPIAGLKASLSYQRTRFRGGSVAGDRPDENLLLGRLQLYF